jgi:hypothetical protein
VEDTTQDIFSSRPYKIALTVAIVLLLVTLTSSIVIILIADARQEDRETAFNQTLTAVYGEVGATQTSLAPLAADEAGDAYAFALVGDGVTLTEGPGCAHQYVFGQVLSLDPATAGGVAVDAVSVRIWGDYMAAQTVSTGVDVGQEPGHWRLALEGTLNRRVWVQLGLDDRLVSAPVPVRFAAGDCDHTEAMLVFQQIAPLE